MRASVWTGAMALMMVVGGCSTSTLIRPLKRGQWAVGANLGGPMIAFKGAAVPVPLSGVLVARGFADSTAAFARVHATSATFGVLHLELGALKEWKAPAKWRPGFSASPSLHFMLDTWQGRTSLYPQVDVNACCFVGNGRGTMPPDLLHAGIMNWFELHGSAAEGRAQRRNWLPAFHLGYTMARPKWNTLWRRSGSRRSPATRSSWWTTSAPAIAARSGSTSPLPACSESWNTAHPPAAPCSFHCSPWLS